MEARGFRSYFEDQKYNTSNFRYGWTQRDLNKQPRNCQIRTNENPPVMFPSVLAFLCSTKIFNWSIELYNVSGENEETQLILINRIPVKIKGLGISNPTTENLRFSEEFVPLSNNHQSRVNSFDSIPPEIGRAGHQYWTEERGFLNRFVSIPATPLGLVDLDEFEKQWASRPHGRLLDICVFLN